MFKLLGWLIKASLFAVAILILGNVLQIGGQTISDRVRTSLSRAEQLAPTHTIDQVETWTSDVADKAKRAADEFKKPARRTSGAAIQKRKAPNNRKIASENTPVEHLRKPLQGKIVQSSDPTSTEGILASERQELRALIRELNSSTEKLTAN